MGQQVPKWSEVPWSWTGSSCQAWRITSNSLDTNWWQPQYQETYGCVKLGNKAKESYTKFDGGMPDTAVYHVITFRNFALKLECKENYNCYHQLIKDNLAKITALGTIYATTDEFICEKEADFTNETYWSLWDEQRFQGVWVGSLSAYSIRR